MLKMQKEGKLPNIMIMKSEDSYFIDNFLSLVESGFQFPQFNTRRFESEMLQTEEMISFMTSFPLMEDSKLAVVFDIHKSQINLKDMEFIFDESYSFCRMIFVETSGKAENKSYTSFKKKVESYSISKLEERELGEFIKKRVKENGAQIDIEALELLAQRTGYLVDPQITLHDVQLEISKLSGINSHIDKALVAKMIKSSLEEDVFNISKHLVENNAKDAVGSMLALIKDGHSSIELLSILVKQYYNYTIIKYMSQKGYSNDEIARLLGFRKSGAVYYSLKQLRNVSYIKLSKALDYLTQREMEFKSGLVVDQLMEMQITLMNVQKIQRVH